MNIPGMAQLKASLEVIEKWKRKSSELSTHRKDALFTAASRGFEAMSVMINKESNYEEIQRVLGYLNFERSFSHQFEKAKDDPTREIMHGFLESLHLVLTEWAEEKNQVKEIGEMFTQTDEGMTSNQSLLMEPRDDQIDVCQAIIDNNEIPLWDFGEDEKKFNIKDEVVEDDLNVKLNDPEYPFNDQLSFTGNAPLDANMEPSEFMNNEMPFTQKLYNTGDPNLDDEKSTDGLSLRMEDTEDMAQLADSAENTEVEKGRRPSRNVSKKSKYTDYVSDSDDEYEPTPKKSRSKSAVKKNMRKSVKGDDNAKSADNESQGPKKSKNPMNCPECEYSTHSAAAWVVHLSVKHSTTPILAGVALRCECGHESSSNHHSFTCNIANFTVIRTKHKGTPTTTPQCVQCDMYPKTAYGYMRHLHQHHKSSLRMNGIYLKCTCGAEFASFGLKVNDHNKKGDGRDYTVHKRYED